MILEDCDGRFKTGLTKQAPHDESLQLEESGTKDAAPDLTRGITDALHRRGAKS